MSSESSEDEDAYYGPKPPPGLLAKNDSPKIIGPTLPPGFKIPDETSAVLLPSVEEHLEEEEEESSDDEIFGPMPPDHPAMIAREAHKFLKPENPVANKREEWMLIPPKNKEISGLAKRKFLARTPDEYKHDADKDSDEEDFVDKAKKELGSKIIEMRDEHMEKLMETSKRKSESLLDIHKKKKKSETTEKEERKPFDRDTDLAINKLSDKDKQNYIEKSRELGGRFARGKQKFL